MMQKEDVFAARIQDRYCLNKAGASREVWHIVLDVPAGFPSFRPGDSIAIYPENSDEDVLFLQQYFDLNEDSLVIDKKGLPHPALLWLREKVEIGKLTSSLLKAAAQGAFHSTDRERLARLPEEVEREILTHYSLCRFLQEYIPGKVSLEALSKSLLPIAPRLYSIASGPSQSKKGLEIIVARACYTHNGVVRKGVCSHYLVEGVSLDQPKVRVFHHPTKHFMFPQRETSLIMVGAGTGIAPFRAYMQEVESRFANPSQCWLFFGERQSTADFYYEEFWKRQEEEGRLRLHVAFSCDQEHKIYVQHRMWEERKELWRWLQEGAHFFVCGHAKKMALDVEACLYEIAVEEGGMQRKQAEEWLSSMKQCRRYVKDVY